MSDTFASPIMKLFVFVFIATVFHTNASGMVGGWSNVTDTDSSSFQKVVHFASAKITTDCNSPFRLRPMKIISAQKQVVQGMNYKMTMVLGATECKSDKNSNADIKECKFLHCGTVKTCNATVWDKPWEENGTQLTHYSCEKSTKSC